MESTVAIGVRGVRTTPPPPRAGKGPQKSVLSIATKIVPAGPVRGILQGGHQVFSTILMYTEKRPGPGTRNNLSCNREYFFSGIAQESVFVEKDEKRHQQKTSHARRGMVMAWQGTSPKRRRRPRKPAVGLRARRGGARCECQTPSDRCTVELSRSTASVQQHRLIKERLRCYHVQLKVVETTLSRKEQRERERKKAVKACKGSYALSGFGFLPKSDRGPTVT